MTRYLGALGILFRLALPSDHVEASAMTAGRPTDPPAIVTRGGSEPMAPVPAVNCVGARPDLPGRAARLVAAYGFETATEGATPGAQGGHHPAMLVEAILAEGRLGTGVALNGSTGHLRIDQPGWPSGDYSFAAWVLPRTVRDWQAILEIQTPSSRGVEVAVAPGGRPEVWSSGSLRLRHGVALAPGTWTHLAVTRAGVVVTLFVNGVAERAGRDRTVFDFGRCPALVGVDADRGCADRLNGFFAGVLDELRVYDCALPADGIRSIMNVSVQTVSRGSGLLVDSTGRQEALGRGGSHAPPGIDVWLAARLASWLDRSPASDRFVAQGVGYGVLGGVGYAVLVFLFWMQGAQPGCQQVRRRTVTLALGSLVAALLTLVETRLVSWPPPSAHPELAGLYPAHFPANLNENAFPSQSTAVYAAVASGVWALSRTLGVWAWVGVGGLVALPRMYLGGHYLSDVVGGLVAGLGGYWLAVLLLGGRVVSWSDALFERGWDDWRRPLAECVVFLWILQVATEFSLAGWIANAVAGLWK
jgi:membrane-associated phospholipid phosphatase